jgi:argininosuccinate lyase
LLSRTEIDVSKAMLATGNYSHATVNAFELFKGGVPWKESYSIIGKRVRDGDKLITYEPEVYLSYSEGNARKLAEKARKEIESRRKLNERLVREAEEFCAEV